ncbi:5'-nucleotidase C-terminal domain-containing protein [Schaalia canis]|uniref:Bifunctional metallophosphatase/5'-nucleotidase n=1 Tax=Schaalia canis TaxID=100469 RepID=A0A3P1SCR1_9ACTO|nr:5'-nucleotidase C-terminal domain-containing protein [Schaalia canis]RRC95073.1 bifunctional metallophosphatase/5'-nucleotidase [Schaalia canis]
MKNRILRGSIAFTAALSVLAAPVTAIASDGTGTSADTATSPAGPAAAAGTTVVLDLFNLTDIHGRLVERQSKGEVVEAGLAAMQCYMEAHANPNKSFTLLGDNIGASTFESGSLKDNPVVAALNLMHPLASTIGNHEFDSGADVLKKRIDGSDPEYVKFAFPYLGANVEGMGTYGTDTPYLGDYVIKEMGGVKVAYIGVIADDAPAKLPASAIEGITFHDPHPKLAALATSLKAENKADIVVAMLDDDVKRNYSRMPAEVDVLMGGDTHKPYEFDHIDSKETLDSINPHLAGVASGAYTDNLGLVTVTYDTTAKKVVSADAKVIPAATVATAVKGSDCMTNSPIAATINDYLEKAKPLGAVVVSENVPEDFARGKYTDAAGKTVENRGTESTVGNLVADAFHKEIVTKEGTPVDFGVTNAGGLRSDLKQTNGVVTVKDVFNLAPFSNYAAYRKITGAMFKQALENQWTNQTGANSRPLLRLATSSNVTYTYDPTYPAGERVTSILINGKPLDPAATYTVGSTDFLLNNNGDRYFDKSTEAVLTGELDRDVIARHITKASKTAPLTPSTLKRATGIILPIGTVEKGAQFDFAVRGLSFTAGAQAKKVTVAVGTAKGSADVDNTIVEDVKNQAAPIITTDGTGQAMVPVTIDFDAAKVCAAGAKTAALPVSVTSELGVHIPVEAGLTVTVSCPTSTVVPVPPSTGPSTPKPSDPSAPSDPQKPNTPGDPGKDQDKSGKGATPKTGKDGKTSQNGKASKKLAATGASADVLALGAGAIVLIGAGALAASRRRR